MKSLDEVAENYFNTLNPMAEKISADILTVKEAYEDLWKCLSLKERNQIINEAIVHPEALLKYALSSKSYDSDIDFALESKSTGSKYVVDENTGVLWRDEHSAPFSWKTPSQINLSIFTSSKCDPHPAENSFVIKNKNKINQNVTDSSEMDKSPSSKFVNESVWSKNHDKRDSKKASLSHESSNLALVGTCSKLSGLCSKFKFLPSKSYSYEVQTVVANPTNSNGASLLDRIKASAVLKFQGTLKLVGGKTSDKKSMDNKDTENLVQLKGGAAIVKVNKVSPKIAKPKSPPPPPPLNLALKNEEKSGKNLILVKTTNDKSYQGEIDSEKASLLEGTSSKSVLFEDPNAVERDLQTEVVYEMSDDFNSLSTECTPLSGPTTDAIPKSGFDFLDNW